MTGALMKMFLFQAVIIFIIFVVLKNILEKQLVESAIHEVENLDAKAIDPALTEMSIIHCQALKAYDQMRLQNILAKKCHRTIRLNIRRDKTIKAGIIIEGKGIKIDHSLRGRLREGGLFG